jgi:hypothetical protein
MNPNKTCLTLLACALLAGCASADLGDNAAPRAEKEKQYRTGSNIPRRPDSLPDGVSTTTVSPADGLGNTSVPRPGAGGH